MYTLRVKRFAKEHNAVGGAGVAWWRERSPPTNVSRVRRNMLVEFVVGSCPYSKGFSLGFPPSSKTNISKFQFNREFEGHKFIS